MLTNLFLPFKLLYNGNELNNGEFFLKDTLNY